MMNLHDVPVEAWAAISGLVGALIGAIASFFGQLGTAIYSAKVAKARQRSIDGPRENMLRSMLDDGLKSGFKWRKLWRMSLAIGASQEETARLLVAIGARGDISEAALEVPQWGYIREVGPPLIGAD